MKNYMLAPLVVALRMPILAKEAQRMAQGHSAADKYPESKRMVAEKIEAVSEGVFNASLEVLKVNMEMGFMAMRGDTAGLMRLAQEGPGRVASAASAPADKRVRSNVRRLGPR